MASDVQRSMERFLKTYELKILVCAELVGDKKSLYALARSCLDFRDPSLDYLWRTIESFDPLLGCLPTGIWREEVQKTMFTNKRTVVFPNRAITSKDLDRYLSFYARRIRSFHYCPKRDMKILSREMLSSLQAVSGAKCGALTPLLKTFAWEADVPPYDPSFAKKEQDQFPFVLPLFVGDTVTALDFIVFEDADTPPIRMALNRLPDLQSLKLSVPERFIVHDDVISASDSWANLSSLSLEGDLLFSMPDLASLPRLSQLQLHDVQAPRILDQGKEIAANPSKFKSLKHMSVKALHLVDAAEYFLFIPPSNGIHTVQLECCTSGVTSAEECYSAIHILQQHLNPLVLETLEIRDLLEEYGPVLLELYEGTPQFVPGFTISPLFEFTKLKALTLCLKARPLVTEAEVALIAKAWPGIQRLDLCGSWPNGRAPSINYNHLLQIAEGCKALRVLGVPFDGTRLLELPNNSIQSHSVEVLRVCGSTIESDDESVDAIIRSNFPQLRELDASYQSWLAVYGPIDDLWGVVAQRLQAHIE